MKLIYAICLVCLMVSLYQTASIDSSSSEQVQQIETTDQKQDDKHNITEECVKPSIDDFPNDLFTQKQRRSGAIIVHILFALYLFKSILIVCDEYFMCSIELIGQRLGLDQDVLGATFMAIGSSTPEVFISLVSILMNDTESGIGSSVGSAIFNILFIVGICGLFIHGSSKVSTWPFIRDSFFYILSILFVFLLIRDDRVYWYESVSLLILYALYCVFMMNNDRVKNWAFEKFKILQQETSSILPGTNYAPHNKNYAFGKKPMSRSQSGYSRFNDDEEMYAWGGTLNNIADVTNNENFSYQNSMNQNVGDYDRMNVDSMIASSTRQIDFDTSVFQLMIKRKNFRPKTRFKMAVRRVIDETLWLKRNTLTRNTKNYNMDMNPMNSENYLGLLSDMPDINSQSGLKHLIIWILFIPIRFILYFTIPDCRNPKYKKWFYITFLMSVFWLAVLSYLIVWMITIVGYTIGIPDSLMAITLIAAGTSIPDAYTSVVVVRQGMVDMGVSNIIGSNVFDLLIGLAFPWFIKSILSHGYVTINSAGIGYDSLILFACVISTVLIVHFRKWYLDIRSGYVFLSVYVAFLIFATAVELNVFSFVNPPVCN